MVRIERGNVVLNVHEDEVQHYLLLGYNVTDNTGKILRESIPTDFATLQRFYVEQKARIEELEQIVAKLTTENAELTKCAKSTESTAKATRTKSKT